MPIVKTDACYYDGPFKRVVKFTKKEGFTCELPAAAWPIVGKQKVTSDTIDGCLRNFEQEIKKWRSQVTTTREVLIYRLHRKGCIMQMRIDPDIPDDKGSKYCIFKQDDMFFERGIAMSICAGVFLERKITMGSDVRYEYEQIDDRLPDSIEWGAGGHNGLINGRGAFEPTAIDTTPELEAFFTNVAHGMEKMLLMFEQLQDQKKVLAFAAAGTMLLPETTEKSPPEGS